MRAGYEVTVYEEKSEVGHRFNGDFQGLENWSSDKDIIEILDGMSTPKSDSPNFICQPYKKVTVYNSNLKGRVIQSKRPIFYLVMRGSTEECLDYFLMKTALDAGVNINFNHKKDELEHGGIIALGPRAADAIAKGITFKTDLEDMAVAIVNNEIAPKGYAYLLVCKGRGTIATVLFKDFKRERIYFERAVEAFRKIVPVDIRDGKEFGGYVNFFFNKPAYERDKYFVGEAAGLQDCLWGFGMRYAMESGYLAARSIIEKRDYEELLKEKLLPLQRTSLVNRFIFSRTGNRSYNYFINIFAGGDAIKQLKMYYNPSFLKRLIYPIVSWSYKSRLIDKGCHDEDCTCVWCKCKK